MSTLRVSEVFYSPQGEGARAGEPSLFVRLSGCSAKHACFQMGVACDTEFESGEARTLEELQAELDRLAPAEAGPLPWIVWTGGEPLDQLTPSIVNVFRLHGYKQALETSGVRPFPRDFRTLFDWIACSPKVAEHVLLKHFGEPGIHLEVPGRTSPEVEGAQPMVREFARYHVHELRYVRHAGQGIPKPLLSALTYYVSPHSDGFTINRDNVRHVVGLCKEHPRWRVSVQMHKVWGVL